MCSSSRNATHDGAVLEQSEQRALSSRETREQVGRFSEYRLTDEHRGVEFLDACGGPEMKSFRSIEEGDPRPRINDGLHRARSP